MFTPLVYRATRTPSKPNLVNFPGLPGPKSSRRGASNKKILQIVKKPLNSGYL